MTDNSEIINKNDDGSSPYAIYDELKELCENNADYFKSDTSTLGKNLHSTSLSIINNLLVIKPLTEHFRRICNAYDLDENTPGNGYRSYVMMVDSFVNYGIKFNRQIFLNRNSYFFRKGTALKELEACDQGLTSLSQMLTHLKVLVEWSEPGCLYPREEHPPEELLARAYNLNQYCFYGRCLGFQFCESMQTVLKALGILMASFSELYYSNGGMIGRATSSLWNSSKYLVNPELRAKRIVNISQYASVNFCKQFWFLGEMETMKRLPNFVSPSVVMNRIIVIPPEPLTIERLNGTTLDVPIPSSHTGPNPLGVRLMSSVKRKGMLGEASSKNLAPVADGFLFHCHGGGFVAQSSRSHETYLCQWAKSVDAPILSVDYSLAPEAPFPRALEDIFYAYCWALNHLNILGTTAKRIVAAGDSAGGNLILALTTKCIMEGIRPPDGLFLAYVPVICSILPSPARMLCLVDPLLPLGFLTGCLRAYACTPQAYEVAVKGFEDKLRHHSTKHKKSDNSNTKSLNKNNSIDIGIDTLDELTAGAFNDNQYNGNTNDKLFDNASANYTNMLSPLSSADNRSVDNDNRNNQEMTMNDSELADMLWELRAEEVSLSFEEEIYSGEKFVETGTITEDKEILPIHVPELTELIPTDTVPDNQIPEVATTNLEAVHFNEAIAAVPSNLWSPLQYIIDLLDKLDEPSTAPSVAPVEQNEQEQTEHSEKTKKNESIPFTVKLNGKASSNTVNGNNYNQGPDYVAGFLDKYVNIGDNDIIPSDDSCTTGNKHVPDGCVLLDVADDTKVPSSEQNQQNEQNDNNVNMNRKGSSSRLSNLAAAIGNTITSFTNATGSSGNISVNSKNSSAAPDGDLLCPSSSMCEDFEEVMLPCPLEMLKFDVPNNPLLSPYYADDEILKQFPHVSFMTSHMDPCLDDCVEFSKKLKRLDCKVTLDVLEGLPHGFLNFSLLSKEAYEASKTCIERINTLMDISSPPVAIDGESGVEVDDNVSNDSAINTSTPMIKTLADNTNLFTF